MAGHQLQVELLFEEARLHKRAIRKHRAALHSCNDALAKLRAICEEHGIALIDESEGATHGETTPHDHRKRQDGNHSH